MNTVLANLTRARNNPLIRRAVPALHLEGPYFSPEDGPRGAHPKNYVRPPDRDEFQRWQETAEGMIRIVTLSPHYDEAPAFIRHLVDDGVAVAIGHTSATPEQIRAAVDAGASLSTHLGNGAHAFLPRHPNYLWEQLAADELSATLIVDGHHLSPSVVRCMVRSKSPDRVILISDAVSVAGLKSGRYRTLNMDVQLTDDGAVRLAGTPFLAGAALKLPRAVMNVHNFARVSFPAAVDMASRHPARFLTEHAGVFLSTDLVIPRKDAPMTGSFTLFKKSDDDLRAVLTVVDGSVVYERP